MRMVRHRVALLGSALTFCMLAAPAQADTIEVFVFDFDFSANPQNQPILDPIINLGDTIEWVFIQGLHSTDAAAGQLEQWDSPIFGPGNTFSHTFTNLGAFNYYCELHGFDAGGGAAGGMSGVITVIPGPSTIMLAGAGAMCCLRRGRRTR